MLLVYDTNDAQIPTLQEGLLNVSVQINEGVKRFTNNTIIQRKADLAGDQKSYSWSNNDGTGITFNGLTCSRCS
jgi:hypothetical protein